MIDAALVSAASEVLDLCVRRGFMLATAESCTGGLVAAALTATPGSSRVLERGYITYSNAAKVADLGVSEALIEENGAVSDEVARAMAKGSVRAAGVDVALSVTGIAGPDGGTPQKPVGLVYIAAAYRSGKVLSREFRYGDIGRGEVRRRSALAALALVKELIGQV
jgi:nicotinamide-nucleotide amidase